MRSYISLIVAVSFFVMIGFVRYVTMRVPTPEEAEFDKRFDRDAMLVKTCGGDPGLAVNAPLKVYRFEEKLWFRDIDRWRQVEGKPENVCDLLDIAHSHEPKPGPLPPGWSR